MSKQSTTPTRSSSSESAPITAKIENLNGQVEWFYGEDFSLDQASARYKKALALAEEIEADLKGLKNEITVLSRDFSQD